MKNRHLSHPIVWSLFVVVSLWFAGCKKDDDTTPTQTATIPGNYKINTLTVTPPALGLYTDIIAASKLLFSNSTCLTDITITFNSNGTATTDNPIACQSLPVPVSTFTGIDASSKWTANSTNTLLTVTKGDGTKTDYTVVSNTNGILKLQWQGLLNYPAPSPTTYTYTMELKRQ